MRETIATESKSSNAGFGGHEGPMGQTILLVEDEEMVRGLMCEVLEQGGYEVLACSTPAEAIEVSRRREGSIDLLRSYVNLSDPHFHLLIAWMAAAGSPTSDTAASSVAMT